MREPCHPATSLLRAYAFLRVPVALPPGAFFLPPLLFIPLLSLFHSVLFCFRASFCVLCVCVCVCFFFRSLCLFPQVLLLQRWYRCRSIRHKYKGCIASAVMIQKRVRGMQAREFRLLQEVAAIIIQRYGTCVCHQVCTKLFPDRRGLCRIGRSETRNKASEPMQLCGHGCVCVFGSAFVGGWVGGTGIENAGGSRYFRGGRGGSTEREK